LQSLDVWQRLLSEAQISLTSLTSSHPELLAGVDALLHFGLISDAKVRELALLSLPTATANYTHFSPAQGTVNNNTPAIAFSHTPDISALVG